MELTRIKQVNAQLPITYTNIYLQIDTVSRSCPTTTKSTLVPDFVETKFSTYNLKHRISKLRRPHIYLGQSRALYPMLHIETLAGYSAR